MFWTQLLTQVNKNKAVLGKQRILAHIESGFTDKMFPVKIWNVKFKFWNIPHEIRPSESTVLGSSDLVWNVTHFIFECHKNIWEIFYRINILENNSFQKTNIQQ